ncbi:hypothetical protein EhV145_00414 [Emiliania huxleyi virus 145]|nr:hypothetical protein EhV145_00414 [Emiliania huxleyi virus 145]AHA55976.1 hypothetical protein EhV164_00389 [Emiliania huxleyi virus 164]
MGENASASDYVKNIDDKFTRAIGHASKTVKKIRSCLKHRKINEDQNSLKKSIVMCQK